MISLHYAYTMASLAAYSPAAAHTTKGHWRSTSVGWEYRTGYESIKPAAPSNPSTPDGTFYSPIYATKVYHCNSTECYFKGY